MKILALADASYIHTQKWARYLTSRGHELEILSFRPTELGCAQVHFVDTGAVQPEGGNWRYLLGLAAVRRQIWLAEPDLLFCHYLTSYGLVGALLKSSLPLVIWLHGTDILVTPRRSPLYRLMARFALSRADLLIMSGDHMKDPVRQLGAASKRALVIAVGVDTARFNQTGPSERMDFTCISSRLLMENSNIDLILRAVARVRQMQPRIQLTIIGDGPRRPRLEETVRYLGLASSVTFLGQLSNEVMPDLLRKHCVYLSATSSDGTSVSLLEAMACGVFPIVSDIPANHPWITSGTNGFLFAQGQSDVLAERILEAFNSQQLMERARRANWEIVRKKGDHRLNMEVCERAVVELLGKQSEQ